MTDSRCENCRVELQAHQGGVNLGSIEGGSRFLCLPCYNAEMAAHAGVRFEHPHFESIVLRDALDRPHEFHFDTRLLGDRVAIDAYEVRDDERQGYAFQHIEFDPEAEPLAMLGRLLEKMRRALSRKHLKSEKHGTFIGEENVVRGRITWDDDTNGEIPKLVIDGQDVSWEQFGRMMMSYEGWQFRVDLKDPSDEA